MTGSIYAIGDIHGCIERLTDLLAKIDADPARDQLVFLGDYIDRGPSSYEVVAYLIELGRRMSRRRFPKGESRGNVRPIPRGNGSTIVSDERRPGDPGQLYEAQTT